MIENVIMIAVGLGLFGAGYLLGAAHGIARAMKAFGNVYASEIRAAYEKGRQSAFRQLIETQIGGDT